MKNSLLSALAVLFASLSVDAAPREWTDQATGRKITAEFVALKGDQVTLSINGKEYQLPVAKLSAEDQAYLKIVGDAPAAPGGAPAAPAETPAKAPVKDGTVVGPIEVEGSSYYYYLPTSLVPGKKVPMLMYSGALGGNAGMVKNMIEGAEICGWIVACSVEAHNSTEAELNQTHISRAVKHLISTQQVDEKRLYFSGASGGARRAFTANKRFKGAGVLAYIAGAQDDELSRSNRYYIISGATDYNRYDTADTFAKARKVSAYRLHTKAHENGPLWMLTEGIVWLQAMGYKDQGGTPPERAAFEEKTLAWIGNMKGQEPHRAAWWANFLKTEGVTPASQPKVAALADELLKDPVNLAYIKGIADIEDTAEDVLAKISKFSEKGHTAPEIQKRCDKLLVPHAETPWIKEVLTALKEKTSG